MIHYQLRCSQAHGFDGWFSNSAAFETQALRRLIECPECGDTAIDRALMAPAVAKRPALPAPAAPLSAPVASDPAPPVAVPATPPEPMAAARLPAQMMATLQRMRAAVEQHCDYVGPRFADEARKIHHGEGEHRAIYGETTEEQAESLAEEGISVARIPWVPRADG
ncbi:DUF1178 family protein [Rhodopila sp.]|uniref:DUF1178 family protein n=1 Tax=Rhodopila sp. TaxID=2480087 RepID=UPI003D0F04FD